MFCSLMAQAKLWQVLFPRQQQSLFRPVTAAKWECAKLLGDQFVQLQDETAYS